MIRFFARYVTTASSSANRSTQSGARFLGVSRAGPVDRIELTIPSDEAVRGFYDEAVEIVRSDDVADRYFEALLAEGALDPHIGLLELAVDYKAQLSVKSGSAETVLLVADLALEDA